MLSYNGGVILKHLPQNKVLSLVLISLVVFAAAELKTVCTGLFPPGEDAPVSGAQVHPHHRRLVSHQPLHHSQRPAGGAAGSGTGPVRKRRGTDVKVNLSRSSLLFLLLPTSQ